MSQGKPWTHDELMLAMNLYCKLPFGQLHHGNPLIIEVAQKLGRPPSSLSMKLCNLASLDPYHQARGIKGLRGASRGDREAWNEFTANWEQYTPKSRTDFWLKKLESNVTRDNQVKYDLELLGWMVSGSVYFGNRIKWRLGWMQYWDRRRLTSENGILTTYGWDKRRKNLNII